MSQHWREVKCRPLAEVKPGLIFPNGENYWKVRLWDNEEQMWLCQNYHGSNHEFFSDTEIRKIMGIIS